MLEGKDEFLCYICGSVSGGRELDSGVMGGGLNGARNTFCSCFGDVPAVALVRFGRMANIPSFDSMWSPCSAVGGGIVDHNFCTMWWPSEYNCSQRHRPGVLQWTSLGGYWSAG